MTTVGTKLGPYEITAKLGEGGMGEVWRATDSRLKRDVALKVLPAAFTEDKERLARFEREAQLLAQLQHPNIASIYGLEESDGVRALVMELVGGDDLSTIIARGPLAIAEALPIARQIAEALEAAHERGIVHRDLKPQNVKVLADGTVKVLDFGLAKAMDAGPGVGSRADLAHSPTLMNSPTLTSVHGTQLGVILGTAAYMAPEQARGATVDKRADVWAFGVVLYEMLVGRSLFAGDTVSDTLAGVLKTDIDFDALPETTPPALRLLLRRCLERNPRNRLHDIADARLELEAAAAWRPQAAVLAAAPRLAKPIALAAVAGALVGALAWRALGPGVGKSPVIASPLRLSIVGSRTSPLDAWGEVAISPDGERVAFVGIPAAAEPRIYVRDLAEEEARPIAGTEGGDQPFWSPDGKQLGFFAHGQLARIDLRGGPPRNLCAAPDPRGGTWGGDGTILFNGGYKSPISRIAAEGGAPVAVTTLGAREEGHTWPSFLPDGRHFIFLGDAVHTEDHHLKLGSIDSTDSVDLAIVVSRPVFGEPDRVFYVRGGALLAQRLDLGAAKLVGDPVQIASQISETLPNHGFEFSVSRSGRLTYRSASPLSRFEWYDRSGRSLGMIGEARRIGDGIALSPDARRVAWSEDDADGRSADVWVRDLERGLDTRITFDPASDDRPKWSPAGDRLAWTSYRSGGGDLYEDSAVNPGKPHLLYGSPEEKGALFWASNAFLFTVEGDVDILPLAPPGPVQSLVDTTGFVSAATLSRDEHWLAYASTESGRAEIFLQPFPPTGRRWQVSIDGGTRPRWRADGRELFFLDLGGRVQSAAIDPGASSPPSTPTKLFGFDELAEFEPAPDGQRFLIRRRVENAYVAPITVLTDWLRLVDGPSGR